jgi:hypothetical protein
MDILKYLPKKNASQLFNDLPKGDYTYDLDPATAMFGAELSEDYEANSARNNPIVDTITRAAMAQPDYALPRSVSAIDAITTEATTGFQDYTPDQINNPVSIPSVLQDAAATAISIPYTAASSGVSAANLLTGGLLDNAVTAMNEGQQALQQSFGSDELNRQLDNINAVQQDKDSNLFDVLVAAANNPRALGYDAIRNLGTMALPTGAALGAGKLAQSAPALTKYVPALGKVAPWMASHASGIGFGASQAANALMNASDTFSDDEMMKQSLGERYAGAGISGLISLIAGGLTEGGAEGQIAKRLLNGPGQAANGFMDYAKNLGKSAAKEGTQEFIEESGNYLGNLFGTNGEASFNEMAKRGGYGGLLGTLTGGVSHVGTNIGAQQQTQHEEQATAEKNVIQQVLSELEKIRQQNEQRVQAQARQGTAQSSDLLRGLLKRAQAPNEPVTQTQEPVAETAKSVSEPEQNVSDNPLDIIIANGGIRREVLTKDLGWTDEEISKLPEGVVSDDGMALLPTKRALKQAGLDTDVNTILDSASRPEAPMDFAEAESELLSQPQENQPLSEPAVDSRPKRERPSPLESEMTWEQQRDAEIDRAAQTYEKLSGLSEKQLRGRLKTIKGGTSDAVIAEIGMINEMLAEKQSRQKSAPAVPDALNRPPITRESFGLREKPVPVSEPGKVWDSAPDHVLSQIAREAQIYDRFVKVRWDKLPDRVKSRLSDAIGNAPVMYPVADKSKEQRKQGNGNAKNDISLPETMEQENAVSVGTQLEQSNASVGPTERAKSVGETPEHGVSENISSDAASFSRGEKYVDANDYLEQIEETDQENGTVTLFHATDKDLEKIDPDYEKGVVKGGIFAANRPDFHYGEKLYEITIPKDSIAYDNDIRSIENLNEKVKAHLSDYLLDQQEVDALSDNELDDIVEAIVRDNVDYENVGEILGYEPENSWELQRIRGTLAREAGYKAVEVSDGYMIFEGVVKPSWITPDTPYLQRKKTDTHNDKESARIGIEEIQRIADELAKEYRNAPELIVVEKASDLPFDAPDDAKGAYRNGRCYLVSRNIDTAEDAKSTFAHEVIGHYGLNGFFGDRLASELDSILVHNKNVQESARKWIKDNLDLIRDVREKTNGKWTDEQFRLWRKRRAIEEALTDMAEKGQKVTGVKKLVYAIQKVLRAIGLGNLANKLESRTDAEALMALHKAELFVRSGKNVDAATAMDVFASFSRSSQSQDYSRTGVFDAAESFAVPKVTIADNFIRAMQDKDIDVKRIQDSILKSGGEISENQDVYLNETLYTSRMSDRLRRLNEDWTKPILEAVQKSGLTLDEAGNWLYARHVILDKVNAKLAEINPDLENNDALSGMSDDEAHDILEQNKDNRALKELGELSDKLARRNVMWLVNGGLITKEEGKAWASKYEHYVPLKRDSDIPETQSFGEFLKNPLYGISEKVTRMGNVSGTRNMETRGKESKRRMGSVRRATNIIANMMANATTTIMRTEKAIVGRSMLDLARANPNPDLWTVDTPDKVKRTNKETGLVEVTYRNPDMVPADNVLVVKENGVEHWIKFNKDNPRAMAIAKSMKGLDAAAMNWLTQSIGATTRYMARWITSRNPVFMLFNLQRDVQHAMFNLSDTPLSGKEGQVLKNILPAMRQYHNLLRGNGEKAGYADEFREAGAETGFVKTFESIHDHIKDLQKELDKMDRTSYDPRVWAEKTVTLIDDYNSIVENGVRLAVYTVARENGQTIRQAARMAKEITVDFNRRGTRSSFINSLWMFTNASIQGHARLIRALAKSKKARIMAAGLVGMGFVMDCIGRALLGDDDETGLKIWDKIPEFDKERYWIIPVPWSKEGYIKIPLPQGLHVLPNVGRMLSEWCFSSRKKGTLDMVWRASLLMVDAFNPFGAAASFGQFITPTIAKPIVQLETNKSFAGQKIFRDDTAYGGYTPPAYQRAWSNTPEHWTKLSKMINDVTGGDDVKPGLIDVPPESIKLIVNSYLLPGTSGNIDKLAGALQKDGTTSKDWPVLSRMYGTAPDEREKERAVYDRLGEIRHTVNAIREYEKQERWHDAGNLVRELGGGNIRKGDRMLGEYDDFTRTLKEMNRDKRMAEKEGDETTVKNIETERKRLFARFLSQRSNF